MSLTAKKQLDLKKQEINFFYGKIGEVESVLKEQKKVNARLRADVEMKIQQLMSVEAQLASERERYAWRKQTLLTDMEVLKETGDARLRAFKEEEVATSLEIAEYDIVASENEKLHARYKDMIREQAATQKSQDAEREERKQKDFDTRMSLEAILRQTVKAADADYQQKASLIMGNAANEARQENVSLLAAKSKWEAMCKTLVAQQQQSYDELVKARVAQEVVAATTSMQETSLGIMAEYNEVLLHDINDLKRQSEALTESIEQKERDAERLEALKRQVKAAKQAKRAAVEARKQAAARAVAISQKVLTVAVAVIEADQVKKSQKLSMMGAIVDAGSQSLQSTSEAEIQSRGEGETKGGDDELLLPEQLSSSSSFASPTPAFDPDEVWMSSKSDVHKPQALRSAVRRAGAKFD